jgi:L-seryl-tRNA(Ser) seleniumtransferase
MNPVVSAALRNIPNVNDCVAKVIDIGGLRHVPILRLRHCVRRYLEHFREGILNGNTPSASSTDEQTFYTGLAEYIRVYHKRRLVRVVNATGVIIHTNLGRSILPASSLGALEHAASCYSNLEFNLETGKRGSRYSHVVDLLCELTGAEAALVVNNNAAAVLIALETLAGGKEAVVSRGQLVEIGGSFRIPDIMTRSGARLVEVGTTNRTHLRDYANAVTAETGLLLRVHCSNYRIVGFTGEVSNVELVQLGKTHGIPVMEDLGSGCFVDLSAFGLAREPTVQETVASGMDIVTFSGDKLLGGPQAGIIVGKQHLVDQIKNNPLNRALRIDKLTLSALESVLRLYLDEATALQEIPTLRMIAVPADVVEQRAIRLAGLCRGRLNAHGSFVPIDVQSQVGGGAMPGQNLASWAVAVQPNHMKISRLEQRLRHAPVPVIGRIEKDRLLLDMRTVADDELDIVLDGLRYALVSRAGASPAVIPSLDEKANDDA